MGVAFLGVLLSPGCGYRGLFVTIALSMLISASSCLVFFEAFFDGFISS